MIAVPSPVELLSARTPVMSSRTPFTELKSSPVVIILIAEIAVLVV